MHTSHQKPINLGLDKWPDCRFRCLYFMPLQQTSAMPRSSLLDWVDYSQVSAAAGKADYLCPNRVVSLETWDAIISMRRVIKEDQTHLTVRHWQNTRQSLTNEGSNMCEVNEGGVTQLWNALAPFLKTFLWFCNSLHVVIWFIYIIFMQFLLLLHSLALSCRQYLMWTNHFSNRNFHFHIIDLKH